MKPKQIEYQGGSFDSSYSPVAPVTTAAALEREQNRYLADIKENLALSRGNEERVMRLQAEMAGSEAKALAQLSKTFSVELEEAKKKAEEDREINDKYKALTSGLTPDEELEGRAVEEAANTQADMNAKAAINIEKRTQDPALSQLGYQGPDGGLAQMYQDDKTRISYAGTSYGGYVQRFMDSDRSVTVNGKKYTMREISNSGDIGLVQAGLSAARMQFIRDFKLGGVNKRLFVKTLGGIIPQVDSNLATTIIRSGIEAQRKDQISNLDSLGYRMASSTDPSNVESRYQELAAQFYRKPTGLTRSEANKAAVLALAKGLEDSGNVDALVSLNTALKVPGQKGTELRNEYGEIINASIERAQGKLRKIENNLATNIVDGMFDRLAGAQTKEERIAIHEETIRQLELNGFRKQARALQDDYEDLVTDADSAVTTARLMAEIESGQINSPQIINDSKLQGLITEQEHKSLISALNAKSLIGKPKDRASAEAVDTYADRFDKIFPGVMGLTRDSYGNVIDPLAGETPLVDKAQALVIMRQVRRELNTVANQFLQGPGKNMSESDRTEKLDALLSGWWTRNVDSAGGKYYLQDIMDIKAKPGEKKYEEYQKNRFSALAGAPQRLSKHSLHQKSQTFFGEYTNGQYSETTRETFNPFRGDKLFPQHEIIEMRDRYEQTGEIDQRLVDASAQVYQAGSPLSLLRNQLQAYDLPGQKARTYVPEQGEPGAQANTKLFMSLNMPAKNAKVLSGYIDVNSLDADIPQLTEGQARSLIAQMPPSSKAIFFNPGSTQRQLYRASRDFWIDPKSGKPKVYSEQPAPSGNGVERTKQVGLTLDGRGIVMWQNPYFGLNGYDARGKQPIGGHSDGSYHYAKSALDIPKSHNSQQKMEETFNYLKRNMKKFGIVELFWDEGGYYRSGALIGGIGTNTIPGHTTHIHVAFE